MDCSHSKNRFFFATGSRTSAFGYSQYGRLTLATARFLAVFVTVAVFFSPFLFHGSLTRTYFVIF